MGLGPLQCGGVLSVNQAIFQHCNMKMQCEYIVSVALCPFVMVTNIIYSFSCGFDDFQPNAH